MPMSTVQIDILEDALLGCKVDLGRCKGIETHRNHFRCKASSSSASQSQHHHMYQHLAIVPHDLRYPRSIGAEQVLNYYSRTIYER